MDPGVKSEQKLFDVAIPELKHSDANLQMCKWHLEPLKCNGFALHIIQAGVGTF